MKLTCKNCNHIYSGHYCNNCGQTAETHRLNLHFLWHEIRHSLFHFDEGILYSGKQLFTRPGHTIREFIEGKRVKHFKPISLVILLATLYGLLYHYFHISFVVTSTQNSSEAGIDVVKFNEWMGTHYAWTTLLTIPLYTIGTSIAFRKQGYNLVEYFILNTYKASQKLFVHLALFPLLCYFNGTPKMRMLSLAIYLIDIVFIYWTNAQFFDKMSLKKSFLLTLLSQLIFLSCLISIILIIELILEIF
ncbi:MAG: DUF3667 domain-containing protein [Flavobacterium sp.]|jgi:hypothetical protein|nr:DUF3667 domain-containing protein [Flavobacterium sp.]